MANDCNNSIREPSAVHSPEQNEEQNQSDIKTPMAPEPPQRINLTQLLKGAQEAIIVHNGEDYRLRLTARGKLILTK